MKKRTLWLALLVLALGGLLYLLRPPGPPAEPAQAPAPPPSPQGMNLPEPEELEAEVAASAAAATTKPRIRNRAEFVAALDSLGYRGRELVDELRAWRIAHGFVAPDGLVDDRDSASPLASYDAMDAAALGNLGDGGDMLALQALAARTQATDPPGALRLYVRAAEQGSTSALFSAAHLLGEFGGIDPARRKADPDLDRKLKELQGSDGQVDLREVGLAYALAAIRQTGPAGADARELDWMERIPAQVGVDRMAAVCGRSLAVFGEMVAAPGGRGGNSALPPVFLAPVTFYDRLPCDDPAPVTPPPDLARCESRPVTGPGGQDMDLWVCAAR